MKELVSGGWYVGVICSTCGLPVYCIEDKHRGQKPIQFSEPGTFRIACPKCSDEHLYTTWDIQLLRTP